MKRIFTIAVVLFSIVALFADNADAARRRRRCRGGRCGAQVEVPVELTR